MQTLRDLFLKDDLKIVEREFKRLGSCRQRAAIYSYLKVVYRLAKKWQDSGHCRKTMAKAMKLYGMNKDPQGVEPAQLIIDLTCDAVDRRLKWKYSRALLYADTLNVKPRRLKKFMKDAGGINACIDLYDELMDPDAEPPDWRDS
jgi:hypothetical protein